MGKVSNHIGRNLSGCVTVWVYITKHTGDPYDYHDCSPFARDFKFWTKEDAEAMITKGWAGGWVDKWWEKVYEVIL